jgi:hypothetical protein
MIPLLLAYDPQKLPTNFLYLLEQGQEKRKTGIDLTDTTGLQYFPVHKFGRKYV